MPKNNEIREGKKNSITPSTSNGTKTEQEEIWKDIPYYKNLYQVSSLGRVRSKDCLLEFRHKSGKIVKRHHNGQIIAQFEDRGYIGVRLLKKSVWIHRLVAESFCANPDNKKYVDHIDTDRRNNVYTNLRWVTFVENVNNPLTRKHCFEAQADPILQFNIDGVFLREFSSANEAAKIIGCSSGSIKDVMRGKAKTCKGFTFVRKRNYDSKKNYKVEYKRGTFNVLNVFSHHCVAYIIKNEVVSIYKSSSAMARAIGKSVSCISQRCRNNAKNNKENGCFYFCDLDKEKQTIILDLIKNNPSLFK